MSVIRGRPYFIPPNLMNYSYSILVIFFKLFVVHAHDMFMTSKSKVQLVSVMTFHAPAFLLTQAKQIFLPSTSFTSNFSDDGSPISGQRVSTFYQILLGKTLGGDLHGTCTVTQ